MPQLPLVYQPFQPLFGGAMRIALPASFRDTSAVQPLPDTREQFYSPEMRVTLVVDLMARLEKSDEEALLAYLHDIDVCSESYTEVTEAGSGRQCVWLRGVTRGEKTGFVDLTLRRDGSVATDFLVYAFYYYPELKGVCQSAAESLELLDRGLFYN